MTVIAERSLVSDLVAMWAGDPLHRMSVRLDLTARQARRAVERALDQFEPDFIIDNWLEVAPYVAAAFLDAQLGALDIAMEYLEAVAGSAVAVDPAPYLGVIGTVDVDRWLESKDNPDAADKTAAAAARRENVAEVAETEPLVVGRDAVATTANNDMRFTHYARVPNEGACDWCRMLATRGAVYTADTVVKTRDGQPYHMRQARMRKDGTTYYPGGPCRCGYVAVPDGASPDEVPTVLRRVTTRQMAAAQSLYRAGATTPQRAATVDRQISILRAQQAAGRGTEWTAQRLAALEAEQVEAAMPRSLLGITRDLAYRYNPQQPRDEDGKWTSGGGGGGGLPDGWSLIPNAMGIVAVQNPARGLAVSARESDFIGPLHGDSSGAAVRAKTAVAQVAGTIADLDAVNPAAHGLDVEITRDLPNSTGGRVPFSDLDGKARMQVNVNLFATVAGANSTWTRCFENNDNVGLPGDVVGSIVTHEYGHVLQRGSSEALVTDWRADHASVQQHSREVWRDAMNRFPGFRQGAYDQMSSYAKSGPVEAYAEAFAEWSLRAQRPMSPLAREIAGLEGWQ